MATATVNGSFLAAARQFTENLYHCSRCNYCVEAVSYTHLDVYKRQGRRGMVHTGSQIQGRVVAASARLQAASAEAGLHLEEQRQDASAPARSVLRFDMTTNLLVR